MPSIPSGPQGHVVSSCGGHASIWARSNRRPRRTRVRDAMPSPSAADARPIMALAILAAGRRRTGNVCGGTDAKSSGPAPCRHSPSVNAHCSSMAFPRRERHCDAAASKRLLPPRKQQTISCGRGPTHVRAVNMGLGRRKDGEGERYGGPGYHHGTCARAAARVEAGNDRRKKGQ